MPTLTNEQIAANVDRFLREQAQAYAEPPTRKRRGRRQRAATRRKIAAAKFADHKRKALANGASPLRIARLERGWTIRQAAERALVSERTWLRAETNPARLSPPSWQRIAASLGVEISALRE